MGQVLELGFPGALGGLVSMDNSSLSADKIAIAVLKARSVAALNDHYQIDKKADLLSHIHLQTDRLLGFLTSQFQENPSTDDVHTLLCGERKVNILDVEDVRSLPDALVPVAIVRELISTHKLPMNPNHLSNWTSFMGRYRQQVMSA